MKISLSLCALAALSGVAPNVARGAEMPLSSLMPRVEDYTQMWWAEGFPGSVSGAPWRRVVQSGSYAFALDTDTLKIAHLGAVPVGPGYAAAGRGDNAAWQKLPGADLSLELTVAGKTYRASAGGAWTQQDGPRLIESGRFVQRGDVTNLVFTAPDGRTLNAQARLETVAWPDRLSVVLAARPGLQPLAPGEDSFGRVGGGFGLDGRNHLEIPHGADLEAEQFTLELWAFVPQDYAAATRAVPWLACKNFHEEANGNYGFVLANGRAQARLNIGGGRANRFIAEANRPLKTQEWNHLAMSYDGDTLRLYLNGEAAGESKIGRLRQPGSAPLIFGRRADNSGDGYHFRGAVDEIRYYNRALGAAAIKARFANPEAKTDIEPVRQWSFRADGAAAPGQPAETWPGATLQVRLATPQGTLNARREVPAAETGDWQEVALTFNPATLQAAEPSPVTVQAREANGAARPVTYEAARGWHRVNLDGIEPQLPNGERRDGDRRNDGIERVKLLLGNPTAREQTARLLFEKTSGGIRQRLGAAITGVSAVLRDAQGHPTGIPVQLSKNWHTRPEGGVYAGQWFHGFSQVRLPAQSTVELELVLTYGHWGGVAAASHAQLCLIGWGSNQLWDQSALGAWGESICYEPDQAQARAAILDVRPLMVASMSNNQPWSWTHNVGGGDFFRMFDPAGQRVPPAAMRTAYLRHGPCLTEVSYAGRLGATMKHSATVSLGRSDDIVRGVYRLRLDVTRDTDFSRFVLFQIGADSYSYTAERKMALGNENGLLHEWNTQWGGETNRTAPRECTGRVPWISLHDAVPRREGAQQGAWANRGLVIRSWQARLGGKNAAPWIVERGAKVGGGTSTLDIVPPPGVTRLEAGDYVEAVVEHIVMPQAAADYYGPNAALRAALQNDANTYRMIEREARLGQRRVAMQSGTLENLHPAIAVRAAQNRAAFTLSGGIGYVPVTFGDLTTPRGFELLFDGVKLDQSVHGNDFWQADFDAASRRWSLTYNLPIADDKPHRVELRPVNGTP